jgi:tetratricopeptide (TPR) repeat protein
MELQPSNWNNPGLKSIGPTKSNPHHLLVHYGKHALNQKMADENAPPSGGGGGGGGGGLIHSSALFLTNQLLGDNNHSDMTEQEGPRRSRWTVTQHFGDLLSPNKENEAGRRTSASTNPPSSTKKKTPFNLWGKNIVNTENVSYNNGGDDNKGTSMDVCKTPKKKTLKKKKPTQRINSESTSTSQTTVVVASEPAKKAGTSIFSIFSKSQPKSVVEQPKEEDKESFDKYEIKWTASFDEFDTEWERYDHGYNEDDHNTGEESELLQLATESFQDGSYHDPREESDDVDNNEEALGDLIQEVIQLNALDPTLLIQNGEFTETAQQLIGGIQALTKELNTTTEPRLQQEAKSVKDSPTFTGAASKNGDGHKLFLKGDFERAMALYDEALSDLSHVSSTGNLDPRLPRLKEHMSDLLLNTACELEMATVVANVAECHIGMEKYDMASNTAQRALEYDPHNTKAWLQMARAEFHLKNYCQAALSAEMVQSVEGDALYQEIKQQLQPIIDQHKVLFHRIIDSYRLRVEDEYNSGIVGRNSLPALLQQNSQSQDSGSFRESPLCGKEFKSLPLKHFRGYLRAILVRNLITQDIQETIAPSSGDLFQALCFMAMSDDFSNVRLPVTLADIEAYYQEHRMDDTVESLRQFAVSVLGPIEDLDGTATKISLTESCMSDNEDDGAQEE